MTSDVSNYEQILTHRTGNLVKNISLSVMLILFVCFLYLPAGLILIAISLLFIPNMWLSFRIVKKYGNARNSVCAEAVSSIVEYVNGIQTLRAYGMGGTRNKTITDILREYSQVSYKYEATGIPVSFFFNMLTWLSLCYARDLKTVDVGNSIRRRLFDGCHDAYDACKIIYDNLG